eukprot:CAMPEP_0114584034 /NCGR_PEP_ID=MMETSP0125-20121206/7749_1 /TAXON_ID=485358 ORGANISM="Aristerostoma sp., Strain ATCC 50986" /NCGR_SAMPLE_ID=MMETSP0125 /ASSEMBLY_ACC=CAM_ASM_000245 /LENGTH=98 /DNA_ID=CAMNT_0001778051 /DNA_START=140 /DNA_END=436 /DNA_ORIENTATION=+
MPNKSSKSNPVTPYKYLSTKNIVRNYGKAICRFALSPVGKEYIFDLIKSKAPTMQVNEFLSFIKSYRDKLDCMQAFIDMVKPKEMDDNSVISRKEIMR